MALWRMRTSTGMMAALPALLIGLWYSQSAQPREWDGQLMHIRLHDILHQQFQPQRAIASAQSLPTFALELKGERLSEMLNARKQPYVQGKLSWGGSLYKKTEVRLRGKKDWHLYDTKKSLRIKLDSGRLIEGQRHFNFNNPNEALLFGEKLAMDLAREQGLMTTPADFARLSLNGMDLGVYTVGAPVSETLLRRARRIPANIYARNSNDKAWDEAGRWKREAAYHSTSNARPDLTRLLQALNHGSDAEFSRFADQETRLDTFAILDALRLYLGGRFDKEIQYALTFDPYTGKWEPIVYGFEAFRETAVQSMSEDRLFARLATLPTYRALRGQALERLHNTYPLEVLRTRGEAEIARLSPDLQADRYWKANKQLPALNSAYRQLMRPMALPQLQQAWAVGLETQARRLASLPRLVEPVPAKISPTPETVILGPGTVDIPTTQVYAAHQTVVVRPGTTLHMGPGAGLIFQGPTRWDGSDVAPIRVIPASTERWGGIAIHGPNTAGSVLRHVQVNGGTAPQWRANVYPGMVNIHQTQNITLSHLDLRNNHGSDDLVHTVYVSGLKAEQITIADAFMDAWDLEFTQGHINGLTIQHTGDDGLDLMGVDLQVRNSRILFCRNNAISAGEESQLRVVRSLIAEAGSGTLAKNAATVDMTQTLIYRAKIGLELNQEAPYYSGLSRITSNGLFVADSKHPVKSKDMPWAQGEVPSYQTAFSSAPVLKGLRQMLALSDWQQLPAWLEGQR
jgi:hypothetical protein